MTDQDGFKLLYEAFFAIAESYTSIIYMDMSDGNAYAIRLDDYSKRYENFLNTHPSMYEVVKRYAEDTVHPADRDGMMKLADREIVLNRLETENPLHHIYRAIHDDNVIYYRVKIVPIEDGKKLIYGFENINPQYRRQIEANEERQRTTKLFDGLSREYLSVWYLDGRSGKVTLVRNNGLPKENEKAVKIGETMVDYHFSMQKYFGSFVKPEDFERLMHETSYDVLVANTREDDFHTIDYTRINEDGTTSHFQACYAKIVDEAQVANFVFGFRNTDRYKNK